MADVKGTAYQVWHHSEEFGCPWCGAPVYVGERAFQAPDAGQVYCSRGCWQRDTFDAGHGNGGTVGTMRDDG